MSVHTTLQERPGSKILESPSCKTQRVALRLLSTGRGVVFFLLCLGRALRRTAGRLLLLDLNA